MQMLQNNENSLYIKKKFDSAPGGFFITDTSATILYANKSLENKTGYSVHEIVGKTPGKLWGKQMPATFYQKMWQSIAGQKIPFISPVKNRRKQGELYDETMRIAPIFDKEKIAYYIAVQPIGEYTKNEKEFFAFMRQGQQDTHLLVEKLSTWIGEEGLSLPTPCTPSEFLQSFFIEPTQEVYKKRLEDKELLLFAQQKISNFNILYEKYYQVIFDYFKRRLGGDAETSKDLTQETFLRAFSHLSTFVPSNASYQTYLIRIAHNILVNHYRKHFPQVVDEEVLSLLPDKTTSSEMDKYLLSTALQTLNPLEQKVMQNMYEEGLSVKEIADQVGKTENAVKLLLSRTRKKLRAFLKEE